MFTLINFAFIGMAWSISDKYLDTNLHITPLEDPSSRLVLENNKIKASAKPLPNSDNIILHKNGGLFSRAHPSMMIVNGTNVCHLSDNTVGACTGSEKSRKFNIEKHNSPDGYTIRTKIGGVFRKTSWCLTGPSMTMQACSKGATNQLFKVEKVDEPNDPSSSDDKEPDPEEGSTHSTDDDKNVPHQTGQTEPCVDVYGRLTYGYPSTPTTPASQYPACPGTQPQSTPCMDQYGRLQYGNTPYTYQYPPCSSSSSFQPVAQPQPVQQQPQPVQQQPQQQTCVDQNGTVRYATAPASSYPPCPGQQSPSSYQNTCVDQNGTVRYSPATIASYPPCHPGQQSVQQAPQPQPQPVQSQHVQSQPVQQQPQQQTCVDQNGTVRYATAPASSYPPCSGQQLPGSYQNTCVDQNGTIRYSPATIASYPPCHPGQQSIQQAPQPQQQPQQTVRQVQPAQQVCIDSTGTLKNTTEPLSLSNTYPPCSPTQQNAYPSCDSMQQRINELCKPSANTDMAGNTRNLQCVDSTGSVHQMVIEQATQCVPQNTTPNYPVCPGNVTLHLPSSTESFGPEWTTCTQPTDNVVYVYQPVNTDVEVFDPQNFQSRSAKNVNSSNQVVFNDPQFCTQYCQNRQLSPVFAEINQNGGPNVYNVNPGVCTSERKEDCCKC